MKKLIVVVVLTGVAFGAMSLFGGKKSGGAAVNVDAQVSIRARIDSTLVVHFTETYSINSDKVTNGNGRRWILLPPGNTYEFEGVYDTTSGSPQPISMATSTGSSEGGDVRQEIHWRYPPKSGTRTFEVRYAVTGAARPATGGGYVFSWTFFDAKNPLNIEKFDVTVMSPNASTPGTPAFVRYGGSFESVNPTETGIESSPGRLPAFTIAEATFPFTGSSVAATGIPTVTGSAAEFAQTKKTEWDDKAASERMTDLMLKVIPVVLAAVIVGLFWLVFHIYGREYKIDNPPIYERDLPTNDSPAEVGWLTRFGTTDITDLTGTIVDLARRRYLRIQEPPDRSQENVILVATPEKAPAGAAVASHEMRTLTWLFPDPSGWVDFEARKAELKANQSVWMDFWKGFTGDVEALGNSKGYIERKASGCLVLGTSVIGLILIVVSVFLGINTTKWWIATAFAGAVLTAGSGGMSKRTRAGALANERWQAFKRYIHDFSTIPDHPPASVVVWEHYLAYAIPLGEGDTVIEYMKLRPPTEGDRDWYPASGAALLWMSSGVGDWQTAGTPSSSGSGGGGGFSGGGGGGFGGGGGASFD